MTVTLTRRDSLIYLLETLPEALTVDANTTGRAGGNSPLPQLSAMYHDGSYRETERALHWLRHNAPRRLWNNEWWTGPLLWKHVTAHYHCPYTIRTGCPNCGQLAPATAPMHHHRAHGMTRVVPMQPMRVPIRPDWIRPELVSYGVDMMLTTMPHFIRIPDQQERAA